MKTQGFTTAMVPHGEHATHPSGGIRRGRGKRTASAIGFRPTYKIYRYTRDVP
jgi:hypothetical protein